MAKENGYESEYLFSMVQLAYKITGYQHETAINLRKLSTWTSYKEILDDFLSQTPSGYDPLPIFS